MFIELSERGESTPLDMYPELDGLEEWVYLAYNDLSRCKSGEHYVSIAEYKSYFELYPTPISLYTLLRILMIIDHEVLHFREKLREARRKSNEK